MQFSMEEVLHELALDSDSDDKPSSFESADFGWIIASYVIYIHTKFGGDLWRNTKVMGHSVRRPIFLACFVRQVWSKMEFLQLCSAVTAGQNF